MRKWPLRRELRARRREIADHRDVAADGAALAGHAMAWVRALDLGAGDTVTLYAAFAGEPATAPLLAALQAEGIRVLLPITEPDFDLDWFDAADPTQRPLGHDAIGEASLVLAPGLAVDRTGTRMGQGGGCYDRALPRRAPGIPVLVLLHPGEVREELLPREDFDQPVDGVLTAQGYGELASGFNVSTAGS